MGFLSEVREETRDAREDRSGIDSWLRSQPDFDGPEGIRDALADGTLTARRILTKLQERGFPFTLSALQNYRSTRRWEL